MRIVSAVALSGASWAAPLFPRDVHWSARPVFKGLSSSSMSTLRSTHWYNKNLLTVFAHDAILDVVSLYYLA